MAAAAAAGKKASASLSLFMEVNNLDVEEELSTMPMLAWAEGVWLGRWRKEQLKAWRKQIATRLRRKTQSKQERGS